MNKDTGNDAIRIGTQNCIHVPNYLLQQGKMKMLLKTWQLLHKCNHAINSSSVVAPYCWFNYYEHILIKMLFT